MSTGLRAADRGTGARPINPSTGWIADRANGARARIGGRRSVAPLPIGEAGQIMRETQRRPVSASDLRERRRSHRRELEIMALLKNSSGMRIPVTVTNICEEGCAVALKTGHAPSVGAIYCLKIGDLEAQASCTIWSSTCEAGLQFLAPLAPYVVDHIVGEARPSAPEPPDPETP
jgi:hypothetical protein